MKSEILADVKAYYRSKMENYFLTSVLVVIVGFVVYLIAFSDDKRKGGAIIILIVVLVYFICTCIISILKYINLKKSIKELCPTETEQIELVHDFKEAISVFSDEMRIGKDYTYIASETGCWIIDTQKIDDFSQEHRRGRGSCTVIYAVVVGMESVPHTRTIYVTSIADVASKSAEAHIQEAKSVLRQMQKGAEDV